jgi:hypothetical protein
VRRPGEVEALEQVGGAAAPFAPAEVVQIGDEDEVLVAGEQVVDRRELPGHADRGAGPRRARGRRHGPRRAGHRRRR